jgi:hypothetical protein
VIPTSLLWSAPAPPSPTANSSNDPTTKINKEVFNKRREARRSTGLDYSSVRNVCARLPDVAHCFGYAAIPNSFRRLVLIGRSTRGILMRIRARLIACVAVALSSIALPANATGAIQFGKV